MSIATLGNGAVKIGMSFGVIRQNMSLRCLASVTSSITGKHIGQRKRDTQTTSSGQRRTGNFIDLLRVHVKAGSGGTGYPRFGGIGGSGGNIYVTAQQGQTLAMLCEQKSDKRFQAECGTNSRPLQLCGNNGNDLVVPVPPGVRIFSEEGRFLGEVKAEGDRMLVAKGGAGGNSENNFLGRKGDSRTVVLDLLLASDACLLGFQNAGISALFDSLCGARGRTVKSDYLQVQNIHYTDGRIITLLDLPACTNTTLETGRSNSFLKHSEQTKLMLYVVDANGFRCGPERRKWTCIETVVLLNKELELYSADCVEKPALLIINNTHKLKSERKVTELTEAVQNMDSIIQQFPETMRPKRMIKFNGIIPVSDSRDRMSLQNLMEHIRKTLDVYDNFRRLSDESCTSAIPVISKVPSTLIV